MTKEEFEMMEERSREISEALCNVNADIKYIEITKGAKTSKYAETKERVKAFRRVFPEGSIATKLVEWDKDTGNIVMKAEVFNENGSLLASGYASENVNVGMVNKGGSALENCETSCVSRALGFLGIGIGDGIASAEDMQRVAKRKETEDGLRLCRRCGHKILDALDKKGNVITADQIATETLRVYGDTYCLSCAAEVKKAKMKLLEVE